MSDRPVTCWLCVVYVSQLCLCGCLLKYNDTLHVCCADHAHDCDCAAVNPHAGCLECFEKYFTPAHLSQPYWTASPSWGNSQPNLTTITTDTAQCNKGTLQSSLERDHWIYDPPPHECAMHCTAGCADLMKPYSLARIMS